MTPEQKPASIAWNVTKVALACVAMLWVLLNQVYFLRTNLALVYTPDRPLGVFTGLIGSYSFSLTNSPLFEVFQGVVAIALTWLLGWLLMVTLCPRMSKLGHHAMAYIVGFAVSGVFIELLTMARLLYPLPTWLLWIAMIGGAIYLYRRRRDEYPALFELTEPEDKPSIMGDHWWQKGFVYGAIGLCILITLATFWHALFFPETYWDGLILYLGYARLTFLEHGFPFKAEAQVGLGLGANYPHFYSTYGAMASMLFDNWSDLPQRLAAPVTGLLTTLLIYLTVLETYKRHDLAAMGALIFRSLPNGIAYSTYASDYAFAILYAAAFLYSFMHFIKRPRLGEFILFTSIPATSMHLNFLMGILWVPWLAGVLALAMSLNNGDPFWKRIIRPLTLKMFWVIYLGGLAVASPWYIRNTVLTGNPVYAFFPEIFTASIRVNPEVLRSAELEWFRVGDGVGKLAELYHDIDTGQMRKESDDDYRREADFADRVAASYPFWVGYDVFTYDEEDRPQMGNWGARVAHLFNVFRQDPLESRDLPDDKRLLLWPHAYKYAPLFGALLFPGFLAIVLWTAKRLYKRDGERTELLLMGNAAFMSLLLLGYMYLLADFYLYQIIAILPSATLVGLFLFDKIRRTPFIGSALWNALLPWGIVIGIAPGLAFALMNFKTPGTKTIYGQTFSAMNLDVFRNPGMDPRIFYRLRFDQDPDMWDYLNENLLDERLLTHENRHYVIDPSITIVQLDDWDIQQGYGIDNPEDLFTFLKDQGINYYLRIPNEANHKINLRLRIDILEDAGWLKPVYTAGNNQLFEIVSPSHND